MKQKIEIEVPNGKKAVWKDGTIIFEDIKLPKTWEEYCKCLDKKIGTPPITFYLWSDEKDKDVTYGVEHRLLLSWNEARKHFALMKLHLLKDYYCQGWEPVEGKLNYNIYNKYEASVNDFRVGVSKYPTFLSFPTRELAFEFLENFKYLLVEAKELI